MAIQTAHYPVTYSQTEPESLSRWLWLLKWILLIPHMVILIGLSLLATFAVFISWIAIIVTGSHPRGLWDFILGVNRWNARVTAYSMHLTDNYPPFALDDDPDYPVRVTAQYSGSSNRLTTFFRYFLVIPHFVVLWALAILMYLLMFVNLLIVIFTGKPNSELFRMMTGILRWNTRVGLYWYLVTDEYPPFSMD